MFNKYHMRSKLEKQHSLCSRRQQGCFEQSVDDRALFEIPRLIGCPQFSWQVLVLHLSLKRATYGKVNQKHKMAILPRHNLGVRTKFFPEAMDGVKQGCMHFAACSQTALAGQSCSSKLASCTTSCIYLVHIRMMLSIRSLYNIQARTFYLSNFCWSKSVHILELHISSW